jgi:hypothetical protein
MRGPKVGAVVQRRQSLLGGLDVVGDARRVDLQAPLDPVLLVLVQDGVPALGEQAKPLLVQLLVGRRKDVPLVTNATQYCPSPSFRTGVLVRKKTKIES